MKLKKNRIVLTGPHQALQIQRDSNGVPRIEAENIEDACFGQGWVHAHDRSLQVLVTRLLLQGRTAECLKGDPELIEFDKYMRTVNLLPDAESEVGRLAPDIKDRLDAYLSGFNACLAEQGTPHELRLARYQPEPYTAADVILLVKAVGYLGLAESQGGMEKLLVQMIQNKVEAAKLRELFPYLTEPIDHALINKIVLAPPMVPEAVKWLGKLPRFVASNNWAVSGRLTDSGRAMHCSDPHLEVNRLPAIWQEIVMILPGDKIMGAALPGAPGVVFGRSQRLSWSMTHAFMDMIDYRIEHCRGGEYRREDGWKPFSVRKEEIKVKKGRPVHLAVYENELGVLEGDPGSESYLLVRCWSAARGCGAETINAFLRLPDLDTVSQAMQIAREVESACYNCVFADADGNIGYQMCGRMYDRPEGVSGLMPLPAWEKEYDSRGYVDRELLPSAYNPDEGIIVTANQDLNHLGPADPINLPMGDYRARRIRRLLEEKQPLSIGDMQDIQYDLYSIQAEEFMAVLRPLLPNTDQARILKNWNCRYDEDSRGATLFEAVYYNLILAVFGDLGLGREVVEHVWNETILFNDYYGNLDAVLLREDAVWFHNKPRAELYRRAVNAGLRAEAEPYGRTRKTVMKHLLLGDQAPSLLGYNYGPVNLPGSRATVPQGQIMKSAGRLTSFAPSYRYITDMGTGEMHTNLPGGPSDRRFSPWYTNDLENWLTGRYKILK